MAADWIKNIGYIIIPIVIYYFTYLIAYFVLTILVINNVTHIGGGIQSFILENDASVRGIAGGLSMAIGIAPLYSVLRKELADSSKLRTKTLPVYIGIPVTITLAISSSVAINFLFVMFRLTEVSEVYHRVSEHQYGVEFAIGLFLYGVISPLVEESVFRGIVYNRIRKSCPACAAAFVSAFVFGVYHGNIIQGLYGFIVGLLIACIYERLGRLLYAFLFHAAANIAVYTVTSFEKIYYIMMTPHICAVLLLISVFLIYFLLKARK